MIDHVLLDFISALRRALEATLLEQQAVEERFQVDVFLGDVTFETSYSLPGEQTPPRVRADISLEWSTWSQSAYRSWSIQEQTDERPEILVEVALRIQRLVNAPDPAVVLAALGDSLPELGSQTFERVGTTVEQVHETGSASASGAVEISYQGVYRLDDGLLENTHKFDGDVGPLARWVASALVRLADIDLAFLAPDEPGEDD